MSDSQQTDKPKASWKDLPPRYAFGAWLREQREAAGMSQEELVRIINGTEWLVQQFESGWACNREEFNRISALLIQEPQHAKNGSPEQMEWLKRNNEAYTIWLERFVLRNVLDKAFGLEKESKIRIFRNAMQMAEDGL